MRFLKLSCGIGLAGALTASPAMAGFDLPQCDEVGGKTAYRASSETVRFPVVGADGQAEVGQSMIGAARYTVYTNQIKLKSPISVSGPAPDYKKRGKPKRDPRPYSITVPPGWYSFTPRLSEYSPEPAYLAEGVPIQGGDAHAMKSASIGLIRVNPTTLQLVVAYGRGRWSWPAVAATFEDAKCAAWGVDSFRRELVYAGTAGGVITVIYREYTDNYARPAFTQEFKYDLREGKEIGFRGARFEVLNATNTALTFRVLKPLD